MVLMKRMNKKELRKAKVKFNVLELHKQDFWTIKKKKLSQNQVNIIMIYGNHYHKKITIHK